MKLLLVTRHNIVDAHSNKSGDIDLLKPHTLGLIGQEDEQDTPVAKHYTWTQWNNHRWKLISESGIMNTDRVDGVCLLEGIVISTAWLIWVWNCNRRGSFSKLISKTDCTSTVNHLFKCKVKDHARSKKIKICKHIKRYKIHILYIDT